MRGQFGAMKRLHYSVSILLLLSVFLSGFFLSRWLAPGNDQVSERRILYYVDPMNPAHTSDKPGLAPCGMNLEPVYADEDNAGSMASFLPPGSVRISPEKQQLIGVRLTQVEVAGEIVTLRAFGRVAADENAIYRVLAPTEGYLRDLPYAVPTGTLVQKDQLLASYHSTEPLAAQQAYLLALRTVDRRRSEPAFEEQTGLKVDTVDAQLFQAEENLRLAGLSEAQIRELARTRQFVRSIELRAPVAGVVVARNVSPFSRFERNTEFFRIVDLRRVWVVADVFEHEVRFVEAGTTARITLPGRAKTATGTVSDALIPFDPTTRAYKVRLIVDNPDLTLRPDAAVDVTFAIPMKPAMVVAREAVIDSGSRKVVFVDLGNGLFEPRKVETGWSFGDRVEIVGGLMPGERIVTSGHFLIDAESRMKLAACGMQGPTAIDPVCRMEVLQKMAETAGYVSAYGGATYYFCTPSCKEAFDKDPDAFLMEKAPEPPREIPTTEGPGARSPHPHDPPMASDHQGATAFDPVCGEAVDPREAEVAGRVSVHEGTAYYFASDPCKAVFDRHPDRFPGKSRETPRH